MSDVDQASGEGANRFNDKRRDYVLRACFTRHRALESAWKVVSLFGLSSEDHYVYTTSRALRDELVRLTSVDSSQREPAAIEKIHDCIKSLEVELRSIVREISLERMRSTLPAQIQEDKRSVVDLLDLMLGSGSESDHDSGGRLATLDYVVTALCTDAGQANSIQDPLTLSPRLYGMCEIASEVDEPRIAEVTSEFLQASNDAKSINLSQRKAELGELLFVPEVLRAVVAYNVALWDECDPGAATDDDCRAEIELEDSDHADPTTIFVTSALPKLGEALRRRGQGEPRTNGAVDRVAWHMDLDFPTPEERVALLSPLVGRRSELVGTTVLIGLLCQSANVLADELELIGINVNLLTGDWTRDLNDLLKKESARLIVSNKYDEACALSDLRTKYLFSSVSDVQRTTRPARAAAKSNEGFAQVREQATELASAAAVTTAAPAPRRSEDDRSAMRRRAMLHAGSTALAIAAVAGMLFTIFVVPDGLQQFDRIELAQVSPYLTSGRRSSAAAGASFVGVVHPEWSQLEPEVQQVLAEEMVDVLRLGGMRQIMVYDVADALRIQALGSQPPHLLDPATAPEAAGS